VSCWGNNVSGQLGRGDAVGVHLPPTLVQTSGGDLTRVTAIGAAGSSTCAVHDGAMSCWGSGFVGQLGQGASNDVSGVALRVAGVADVSETTGGNNFHCALTATQVACWGTNATGQLNNGMSMSSGTPLTAEVGNALSGIRWIGAGIAHGCASNGAAVWCWGANNANQIGFSPGPGMPGPRSGMPTGTVEDLDCAQDHCCAVVADAERRVACWGRNTDGQRSGSATSGVTTVPTIDDALAVATGGGPMTTAFSCALRADRSIWCWGGDADGQLGDQRGHPSQQSRAPVRVVFDGASGDIVDVAAGTRHACAIDTNHAVWCWGSNGLGQLGQPDTVASSDRALRVPGL